MLADATAKAVATEGVCGHVSAPGVVCTRPFPCGSHQKKAHAEKKRRDADKIQELNPVLEELGVAEDEAMDGFLEAQCEPSP